MASASSMAPRGALRLVARGLGAACFAAAVGLGAAWSSSAAQESPRAFDRAAAAAGVEARRDEAQWELRRAARILAETASSRPANQRAALAAAWGEAFGACASILEPTAGGEAPTAPGCADGRDPVATAMVRGGSEPSTGYPTLWVVAQMAVAPAARAPEAIGLGALAAALAACALGAGAAAWAASGASARRGSWALSSGAMAACIVAAGAALGDDGPAAQPVAQARPGLAHARALARYAASLDAWKSDTAIRLFDQAAIASDLGSMAGLLVTTPAGELAFHSGGGDDWTATTPIPASAARAAGAGALAMGPARCGFIQIECVAVSAPARGGGALTLLQPSPREREAADAVDFRPSPSWLPLVSVALTFTGLGWLSGGLARPPGERRAMRD